MIIEAKGISKSFAGVVAVDNASFRIKKGEVVGFVGANGAGKSTTINMLLGFIAPSKGDVYLFDALVKLPSAYREHASIGFAASDMELPRNFTGNQYFDFVAHRYGQEIRGRREELVKRFSPPLDKKINTLSRGNKQKIALIAAFLTKPKLIILDEPTSGLDPVMQERFLELVREEEAAGTTIFMSSHYLGEVASVCTRVILMRGGKIIDDVSAKELLERSGKVVRIITSDKQTKPPLEAHAVQRENKGKDLMLQFNWKDEPARLQQWLASVKRLKDIEITEYDLEAAFAGVYDEEVTR